MACPVGWLPFQPLGLFIEQSCTLQRFRLLPAAVFKPRHRISQILDESVIPFSTEIRFQQIKAVPVRFPFHQNVAVFHIVVLQLLHPSSQTDIQEQGNETDNQPCQKTNSFGRNKPLILRDNDAGSVSAFSVVRSLR